MVERLAVETFKGQLQKALEKVRTVLDINKSPLLASDVHHQYHDKYLLAELMTRTAIASQVNCLETLGMKLEVLAQLRAWSSQRQHIQLRFSSEERCSFVRKESTEVENPSSTVTEGTLMGRMFTTSTKLVTTVTEYFWKFEVSYKLEVLRGVGDGSDNRMELLTRSSHTELKTVTNATPRAEYRMAEKRDVDISWLINQLEEDNTSRFVIGRANVLCHTPSRNPDVEAALSHFVGFRSWFTGVVSYLMDLFRSHSSFRIPSTNDIFAPVLPLFEESGDSSSQFGSTSSETKVVALVRDLHERDSSSKPLCIGDYNSLLAEELRCLREKRTGLTQASMIADHINLTFTDTDGDVIELKFEEGCVNEYLNGNLEIRNVREFVIDVTQRTYKDTGGSGTFRPDEDLAVLVEKRDLIFSSASRFPAADGIATSNEAVLVLTLSHCADVCRQFIQAISFIEAMLREQLIAAIGKELTPDDFEEYMLFHNRKLFADAYAPSLFCFSVRRSDDHTPEGTLSIERSVGTSIAQPIVTMSARSPEEHKMQFALSASVNVRFSGHRYLHAYLQHQFSREIGFAHERPGADGLSLVSRARQFSSMIVLVGRIVSNEVFEPKHAIVVQNKDELRIPLEMTTIPAAQEFRDAIESLSPEQQSFAKAFRAMQLQSTLFGILVVQIKPQLEKVLNLQKDSLTKEIKLTQDLMQLFSTYQISSDLLSFGDEDANSDRSNATSGVRLEAVRGHAKAMFDMINLAKKEELEQKEKERQYLLEKQEKERAAARRLLQASEPPGKGKGKGKGAPKAKGKGASRAAPPMAAMMCAAPPPSAPSMSRRAMNIAPPPPSACVPAPPPTPQPAPEPSPTPTPTEPVPKQDALTEGNDPDSEAELDITTIPTEIDQRLEQLEIRGTVRPVIIDVGKSWQRSSQKALLASPTSSTLNTDAQKKETNSAFDLLDALTKSGALPLEDATLHVVVAASHCFDQSLLATVVQENVNPIEQVERTALTMASSVYRQPLAALVRDSQFLRLRNSSPALFDDGEAPMGSSPGRNSPSRSTSRISVLGDGHSVRGVVGTFNSGSP